MLGYYPQSGDFDRPRMTPFPVDSLRRQFPALERDNFFLFFDNAAGAQVPARVIEAVSNHFVQRGVQRGGPYRHSREVDATIARTRESLAAFVNARHPQEIAFGLNATSFIRAISLAIGQDLGSRPEVVVTDLDHEANVATWLALERLGARIRWWRVRDDGRLHTSDLDAVLSEQTRVVACTLAANATGSIVDVADVARRARRVGADVFVDAVHFAPHGPIDVQAMDCDYLVCSGYKIFAPHMGFAYCRTEAIARLATFREDFIPDEMPYKLEAGTYGYESVAGMEAAIGYLEELGRAVGGGAGVSRRAALVSAMEAIAAHERQLSGALLDSLAAVPGTTLFGVTDRARLNERVPTVLFTVADVGSAALAEALATRDIGVRSGHMYSPRALTRLGLMPDGAVRASLVHYNTLDEVGQFWEAVAEIVEKAQVYAGANKTPREGL
jgi:cysteine desulfurase family protein (TIGR01976 family)